ncbi:probable cytochrome P450 6a18 [Teleopsis dalmanni]|uniref:probable cytochrome P450 6a18 n=1 Tax=Teleopsis dalmanni TaxID=139649 RepID=UPI0018CD4B6C|nr:probable cytochrome P450 6a18 [Teleopsis dalmanni]
MELTAVLLYILLGLVTIGFYFYRKNLNYWKDRGIPCAEAHPIYGSVRGIIKTRIIQDIFGELYTKYKNVGPFVGIHFFQRPAAFVVDPMLAKRILIKDFSNFPERGTYHNEEDDPLTGHLFALDGAKWKPLRQKLSPTFTSGKMKFMFPTVVNVGEQFIDVLGEMVKSEHNFDVRELCARFTTDVIGTCAFGIECNSLKDPNAEFRCWGRKALTLNRHGAFISGLIESFPKLARKLRMKIIHNEINDFFMRIVHETVELRERKNIKRNDFMDLLVELKKTKTIKLENGEVLTGLTMNEVAAQAFVFFLAGFETSSSTMSFALYELAQHEEIQNKMREEVTEVLAKHNNQLSYECIKELTYVDQVISETLRHYTIVPFLQRQAENEYIVPDNPKFIIEKGGLVIIPSSSFHHDPELYPEPNKFNPDRFSPDMVSERDSINWLAFGEGPRNCIGLRFGKMQARIGLALLIKNFKFSICEDTKIPIVYEAESFLLCPKGGINLRIEKI